MKNDIKMVAYAERDSHGFRGDKTLTHDEGRRTQGGWWSNCSSRPGGIREGKRGMGAPFDREGEWMLWTVISEPTVLDRTEIFLRTFELPVSTAFWHCGF